MKDVANKYEVEQYIRYRHSIQSAVWREEKGKWDIGVENGEGVRFTDECDVFINASGILKLVSPFLQRNSFKLLTISAP